MFKSTRSNLLSDQQNLVFQLLLNHKVLIKCEGCFIIILKQCHIGLDVVSMYVHLNINIEHL